MGIALCLQAVSLIDMEEHKLEPDQNQDLFHDKKSIKTPEIFHIFPTDFLHQDSPSLQIKALAAGARQVAMEVAEARYGRFIGIYL